MFISAYKALPVLSMVLMKIHNM